MTHGGEWVHKHDDDHRDGILPSFDVLRANETVLHVGGGARGGNHTTTQVGR